MKKEKILFENWCEKIVQTTISDKTGTITYTQRYIKSFHKNYENGFIWVVN
jgi:high-affinity K+ transport system ATPase subunit B